MAFMAMMTAVTVALGWGIKDIKIETIFTDLLPGGHTFVHTFKDHPNFGNPLTIQVMLKVKDGTIYNAETLDKVWRMTRAMDLSPAVDHDMVVSISTEKARYSEANEFGIESRALMGGHAPATPEELAEFRGNVDKAANVVTFLISPDETSTMIRATFIEHKLDYGETFEYVQKFIEAERDDKHDVFGAGQPMLTGWVYRYEGEMIGIFGITVAAMLFSLLVYMRNIAGVFTPIITSIVAAIWGFGYVGWAGSNVEPLILVVPLLLVARSFSHAVQMTERYYEILLATGDRNFSAQSSLRLLMAPGVLGIITDATGLFLIGIAEVPMLEKFSIFCGFWAMSLIPTNAFLSPVILSYLPTPKNVNEMFSEDGDDRSFFHRGVGALLEKIGKLSHGKPATATAVVTGIATLVSGAVMSQMTVGSSVEGSAILWEDSEFNESVRQLNNAFPGMNTLEVIFDGNREYAVRTADAAKTMVQLQRAMEMKEHKPTASLSFADYLPEANRLFSGGNPKWLPLDDSDMSVTAMSNALMFGNSTKNYMHVIDYGVRHGTVSFWYKDKKTPTLVQSINNAREVVAELGAEHEAFDIRVGSGTIALQRATNETVDYYQWLILGALIIVIFITCGVAYRSFVAGLLLLFPVNLANLMLGAVMVTMAISLDTNTLPVAAIGIGVGIDYGIYLLSRICEEHQAHDDYGKAIDAAVTTTGKAIFFTATIVLVGILPWYFLSSLKFLADMGLLLVLIMMINMVIALVVVPLLVFLGRPKFVTREHMIAQETFDQPATT
jgi:predicted RND superfamily exporter protein